MPDPHPLRRPLAVAVGLAAAAAAVAAAYFQAHAIDRPLNLVLFGAVGVFAAARAGLLAGVAFCLLAKLAGDLLTHGDPYWSVYLGYLGYPLVGWLVARSDAAWLVGLAAVLGGVPFFLVTNFAAWRGQALAYTPELPGLFESYLMALPFHRALLLNDVVFTPVLFAAHYGLLRLVAREPKPVEVRS